MCHNYTGRNYLGHNYIGHIYTDHDYIGHDYIGQNYIGHDYICQNYIGHNYSNQAYAELIKRGRPNFIEIKGVTYCGGKRPELGMKNVPWHEEVVGFGQKLQVVMAVMAWVVMA